MWLRDFSFKQEIFGRVMYATYKLMLSCTNESYLERDVDDLVREYREEVEARKRNKLIATIFCKLYPMILKIQKKYYNMTPDQKMEYALFHLVKGLSQYNNKKMKFSSFFYLKLSNMMKTSVQLDYTPSKAANTNVVSNSDEVLRIYSETKTDREYADSEEGLLKDISESKYLSSEEKQYCSCIVAGITKTEEIKKVLKIEEKVSKSLITPPTLSPEERKKKTDKQAQLKIKQIKDSIKKKHAIFKDKGIDIFRD